MADYTLELFDLKEVGKDFVVLTGNGKRVKITFANVESVVEGELPPTKEELAGTLKGILCQIGLEAPVVSMRGSETVKLFMDHKHEFGMMRSRPLPYRVASIEVSPL